MFRILVISFFALSMLIDLGEAVEVEVEYSDSFLKHLETELGLREGEFLRKYINADIRKTFSKNAQQVSRVVVTIEGAKPNKPTIEQLSRNAGLSHSGSFGIGGMSLSAIVFGNKGETSGVIRHSWFGDDIYATQHFGTWSDAKRASRKLAKILKKSLLEESLFVIPKQQVETGQRPG